KTAELQAALKVSKNGAAFAAAAGTVAESSAANAPGLYFYTATAGEVGAEGAILLHAHGIAGCDPVDDAHEVAQTAAQLVLATPANKLATDGTGQVTLGAWGAGVLATLWSSLTAGMTTAGSVGKLIADIGARLTQA